MRIGHTASVLGLVALTTFFALSWYFNFIWNLGLVLLGMILFLGGLLVLLLGNTPARTKFFALTFYSIALAGLFSMAPILSYPADWLFIRSNHKQWQAFSKEIFAYEKIRILNDSTSNFKVLNDDLLTFDSSKVQVPSAGTKGVFFSEAYFREHEISPIIYSSFQKKLNQNGFYSFEVKDSVLFFTIDGFLDNCYGFAFSPSGKHPSSTDCGTIYQWQQIFGDWYSFTTS